MPRACRDILEVLIHAADNTTGISFMAQLTIGREAGCSRPTVNKYLEALEFDYELIRTAHVPEVMNPKIYQVVGIAHDPADDRAPLVDVLRKHPRFRAGQNRRVTGAFGSNVDRGCKNVATNLELDSPDPKGKGESSSHSGIGNDDDDPSLPPTPGHRKPQARQRSRANSGPPRFVALRPDTSGSTASTLRPKTLAELRADTAAMQARWDAEAAEQHRRDKEVEWQAFREALGMEVSPPFSAEAASEPDTGADCKTDKAAVAAICAGIRLSLDDAADAMTPKPSTGAWRKYWDKRQQQEYEGEKEARYRDALWWEEQHGEGAYCRSWEPLPEGTLIRSRVDGRDVDYVTPAGEILHEDRPPLPQPAQGWRWFSGDHTAELAETPLAALAPAPSPESMTDRPKPELVPGSVPKPAAVEPRVTVETQPIDMPSVVATVALALPVPRRRRTSAILASRSMTGLPADYSRHRPRSRAAYRRLVGRQRPRPGHGSKSERRCGGIRASAFGRVGMEIPDSPVDRLINL
jgi:hypothetical protein